MAAVEVLYNLLPEMAEQIHRAAAKAVAATAVEIQSVATANAPVDTGHMQSTVYIITHENSTYGQGIVPGKGSNGDALLPEVAPPTDDLTAFVAAAALYSLYVEYGTSRMSAQPWFYPAAETVRPRFEARMGALESQLKGGV